MRQSLLVLLAAFLVPMSQGQELAKDYVAVMVGNNLEVDSRVQMFCSLQENVVRQQRERVRDTFGWVTDVESDNSRTCLYSAKVTYPIAQAWAARARKMGYQDVNVIRDAPIKQQTPTKQEWVPPGFEALLEPQMTFADVFYGAQKITSIPLIYTAGFVEIQNPKQLVNLIPDLIDPLAVEHALSGSLPSNRELICTKTSTSLCGVLTSKPDIAAVIWDENRFRLDVFINSEQFAVRAVDIEKYLGHSSAGWSMMQTGYMAASSETGTNWAYTLSGVNTVAYRENRMATSLYLTEDEFNVSDMVIARDFESLSYQAGYFSGDSGQLSFGYGQSMLGFNIGTNLNTRVDLRQSSGNEVDVFLDSRSEVSIYKDGRLISSNTYDAGNQIIDTTALPSGSYDIDIRIKDAFGIETSETVFYVKSKNLPPRDQDLWFFEAGQRTESGSGVFDDTIDDWLVRTGYRQRWGESSSINYGLTANKQEIMGEIGWFGMNRYFQSSLSFAGTDRNGYGLDAYGNGSVRDWYLSGGFRYINNKHYNNRFETSSLLGESYTQSSLSLSRSTPFGYVSLNGRANSRFDDGDDYTSATLSFSPNAINIANSSLSFRSELTNENGNWYGLLSFTWRMTRDQWSGRISPRVEYQGDKGFASETRPDISGDIRWRDGDVWAPDVSASMTGFYEEDYYGGAIDVDMAGRYGSLGAQVQRQTSGEATSLTYNVNGATAFVVTEDTLSVGGQRQAQAAVVIKIEGETEGVWYDVLVNGSSKGYAVPGADTVIPLRPFERYEVELRERGVGFSNFSGKSYDVTLYPGNVKPLVWNIAPVIIVFGQFVLADGSAAGQGVVSGVEGVSFTDASGFFQASIKQDVEVLSIETKEGVCRVSIPEIIVNNGVANLGVLQCKVD